MNVFWIITSIVLMVEAVASIIKFADQRTLYQCSRLLRFAIGLGLLITYLP